MEAYIDDMLVKSLKAEDHCKDLKQAFELLHKYRMKLNPSKCIFGVSARKFLGFMVTHRGIEANPNKIWALLEMKAPRTKKEIQGLEDEEIPGESTKYIKTFAQFDIEHIPRAEKSKADSLARLTSALKPDWENVVYLERIGKPFHKEIDVNMAAIEDNKED
ncbi:uncharacterized protein LOC131153938 [Malania oleifera]|uniref:uncharacterized protein LOC131153938 n=1 Tax=Malania oleifera TaxID=397392 RepID=UPI0025ADC90F|nr:uncharacterized protein LOC131153938 [Malania oleifera]